MLPLSILVHPLLVALAFERVQVAGLTKLFGRTPALIGVDMTFPAGAITSVEGHNGSGKTTLLQLLAQLARPTRGTIHYGQLTGGPGVRRHIGLLAHASMLYPDLSGIENLELFASIYGGSKPHILALRDRFELEEFADRPVRTCSRGQIQRIALARALLAEPTLLLLDEPSTGLDTEGMERLQQTIRQERERGAIIVLVSHDSSFAGGLADRRIRLQRGRVAEASA